MSSSVYQSDSGHLQEAELFKILDKEQIAYLKCVRCFT